MQQSSATLEDDLLQLFNRSVDLLCIAGLDDGHFKNLNPAWTTRLGWDIDDLLGKPFIDFVHPEDRARTLEEVASLTQGVSTIRFENRYRHQDGTYRRLQWNAHPAADERRIYAVARDVSRRRELEHEILEIIDHERGRLAREMHDGLCQTLAGIAALSATLSTQLARTGSGEAAAQAQEIGQLLHSTIGDARDMARGLDPIGLSATGLDSALATLANNVQKQFGVECNVSIQGSTSTLSKDVAIHMYRIAQEAVSNAIVHGRARDIAIHLDLEGNEGALSIEDNGIGLPELLSGPKGMGLYSMTYRARLIDGSLDVRRRNSGGTAVTCGFYMRLAEPAKSTA